MVAYTGTGTEQDPYLVSTLTDFLTCVATVGAYVKVVSDINAADDENYSGELSEIRYGCKKLYADEEKTIEGITVRGISFFTNAGSMDGRTIENINFKNFEHKLNSAGDYGIFMNVDSSNRSITAKNCKFSMRMSDNRTLNYYIFTDLGFTLNHCAVDFENNGSTINWTDSTKRFINGVSYSNIVLRNVIKNALKIGTIVRSGVVYVNFTTDIYGAVLCENNAYFSYFAFINPRFSDAARCALRVANTANSSYVCLQNPTGLYSIESPLIQITPEHLKDKDYLAEIGFLP